MLARQAEAEEASVYGDPEPRTKLWSRQDPVSLLGAWGANKSGWDELSRIFRLVASRLLQETYSDYRWDIEVADARGDMGYAVGFERFSHHTGDGRVEPITVASRTSTGAKKAKWKIVHRPATSHPWTRAHPRRGRR
jgi:hypothetical protein